MLRRIRACLQRRDAVYMQITPEETLPEISERARTKAHEFSEPPPGDGDLEMGSAEPIPTVVVKNAGSGGATVADVSTLLAPVQTRLERLEVLFEEKIHRDESQAQLFTQLMSELEEYRQDFIYKHVTARVFRDLIQLYDTLDQTLQADTVQAAPREALVSRLHSFREQIRRTLQRQEVELMESAPGAPFDETAQEAIDVRAVDRAEEDGRVVEVVRHGFRYGERLIRPQWVIVGQYQPQQE
jgi:molecular chaperone GrpE